MGEVTYLFCALNCFVSGPFQYISSVCVCVRGGGGEGGSCRAKPSTSNLNMQMLSQGAGWRNKVAIRENTEQNRS